MSKNLTLVMIGVFLLCLIAVLALKIVGAIFIKFGLVILLLVLAYFWLNGKLSNKRE